MSCVVQIFWRKGSHPPGHDNLAFSLVEIHGAPDFEAVCEMVAASEALIPGTNLITSRGASRAERIVRRRVPIAFRGSAVDRLDLPVWSLVEEAAP